MRRVACSDVKAGDVVAESVVDSAGKVIIGAGTELTARHVRGMLMWGIREVCVAGDPDEIEDVFSLENYTPAQLARAGAAAENLFLLCDRESPVMSDLFDICVERIVSGKRMAWAERMLP